MNKINENEPDGKTAEPVIKYGWFQRSKALAMGKVYMWNSSEGLEVPCTNVTREADVPKGYNDEDFVAFVTSFAGRTLPYPSLESRVAGRTYVPCLLCKDLFEVPAAQGEDGAQMPIEEAVCKKCETNPALTE